MILKYAIPIFIFWGVYTVWVVPTTNGFGQIFLNFKTPVKEAWTGIAPIDMGFTVLVKFFVAALEQDNLFTRLSVIALLANCYPLFTLMSIEAGRTSNRGGLLMSPLLWGMLGQSCGFCVAFSTYAFLYLCRPSANTKPTPVPASVASAIAPSLVLGYLLPTLLILIPPGPSTFSDNTHHTLIGAWQFFPLWVYLLQKGLEKLGGIGNGALGATYLQAIVVAATGHLYMLSHPLADLWREFKPTVGSIRDMSGVAIYILKFDYWITFGAAVIWALLMCSRRGVVLGCAVLGPGAAIAGAFWWRDMEKGKRVGDISKAE